MKNDDSTTSREKVLKKIRKALLQESTKELVDVDVDTSVYHDSEESLDVLFATNFSEAGGKFVFCESENDFVENFKLVSKGEGWEEIVSSDVKITDLLNSGSVNTVSPPDNLTDLKVAITYCECLIARTGSVMVSSKQGAGRRLLASPQTHVVIAYSSQLLKDIKYGLKFIKAKYKKELPSMLTIISGESSTLAIENTLVKGGVGAKELFLFLIDDEVED